MFKQTSGAQRVAQQTFQIAWRDDAGDGAAVAAAERERARGSSNIRTLTYLSFHPIELVSSSFLGSLKGDRARRRQGQTTHTQLVISCVAAGYIIPLLLPFFSFL